MVIQHLFPHFATCPSPETSQAVQTHFRGHLMKSDAFNRVLLSCNKIFSTMKNSWVQFSTYPLILTTLPIALHDQFHSQWRVRQSGHIVYSSALSTPGGASVFYLLCQWGPRALFILIHGTPLCLQKCPSVQVDYKSRICVRWVFS